MRGLSVWNLKVEQDRLDSRKEACLKVFGPFRDALFDYLQRFVEEPAQRGLRGVEAGEVEKIDERIRRMRVRLNGIPAVLIACADVHWRDWRTVDQILAAKILVYPGDELDPEPWAEVAVQLSDDGTHSYSVLWLRREESYPIGGRTLREESPDVGGREAAECLIRQYYDLESHWADRPRLGVFLRGGGKAPIGFSTGAGAKTVEVEDEGPAEPSS